MNKFAVGLMLLGVSVAMAHPLIVKMSATPTETPVVAVTQELKEIPPAEEKVEVAEAQTRNVGETRNQDVAEMEQYMRDYGQARGEYYREKYGW